MTPSDQDLALRAARMMEWVEIDPATDGGTQFSHYIFNYQRGPSLSVVRLSSVDAAVPFDWETFDPANNAAHDYLVLEWFRYELGEHQDDISTAYNRAVEDRLPLPINYHPGDWTRAILAAMEKPQ